MVVSTNEVWEEFSNRLKQFIFKRVQNAYDTEDILQDVFCKIHHNADSLKNGDRLEAWIYRITRNTIIDYYRQHRKLMPDLPETVEAGMEITAIIDATDNALVCLKPMINALPEKYRQAIILTEYEGLSQREMAEELGLSLSGAKSRVQRAREKLKEMLLECCHFEFDRLGNILDYRPKEKMCHYCVGNPAKE